MFTSPAAVISSALETTVSDPHAGPRKPSGDEEVDELPGESAPAPGASELSLEEQIAQMADLEIEGEEDTSKKS